MSNVLHFKFWILGTATFQRKVMAASALSTLKFRTDGTPRLLIITFFATVPNLIQHSPFINSGEFCQPPFLFQTPRLLIHVQSRQR